MESYSIHTIQTPYIVEDYEDVHQRQIERCIEACSKMGFRIDSNNNKNNTFEGEFEGIPALTTVLRFVSK